MPAIARVNPEEQRQMFAQFISSREDSKADINIITTNIITPKNMNNANTPVLRVAE